MEKLINTDLLTPRDYFAIAAMPALLENVALSIVSTNYDAKKHSNMLFKALAGDCYKMADAMMAEREKGV